MMSTGQCAWWAQYWPTEPSSASAKATVPAAAHYEQVRVGRGVQQHLGRVAVDHPSGDPAAFVRRHFLADHGVKSLPGVCLALG